MVGAPAGLLGPTWGWNVQAKMAELKERQKTSGSLVTELWSYLTSSWLPISAFLLCENKPLFSLSPHGFQSLSPEAKLNLTMSSSFCTSPYCYSHLQCLILSLTSPWSVRAMRSPVYLFFSPLEPHRLAWSLARSLAHSSSPINIC